MPAAPRSVPAPGLEQLLSLVTPADTLRGMFFNGLLDATGQLGGEELRAKCLRAIGERRFVDFFNYPVADLLKALFTTADLLGPKLGGREAVMRQLGRRATEDFLRSTVGKTLLALAGNEPQRLLSNFPSACKASLSYGTRTVEFPGDKEGRLVVRRDFLPVAYNEGILIATMELAAVRNMVVRGHQLDVLDADYEVRWE